METSCIIDQQTKVHGEPTHEKNKKQIKYSKYFVSKLFCLRGNERKNCERKNDLNVSKVILHSNLHVSHICQILNKNAFQIEKRISLDPIGEYNLVQ